MPDHQASIHGASSQLLHVGIEGDTRYSVSVSLEVTLQAWVFLHTHTQYTPSTSCMLYATHWLAQQRLVTLHPFYRLQICMQYMYVHIHVPSLPFCILTVRFSCTVTVQYSTVATVSLCSVLQTTKKTFKLSTFLQINADNFLTFDPTRQGKTRNVKNEIIIRLKLAHAHVQHQHNVIITITWGIINYNYSYFMSDIRCY